MSEVKTAAVYFPENKSYNGANYAKGETYLLSDEPKGFIDRWLSRGCKINEDCKNPKKDPRLEVKEEEESSDDDLQKKSAQDDKKKAREIKDAEKEVEKAKKALDKAKSDEDKEVASKLLQEAEAKLEALKG